MYASRQKCNIKYLFYEIFKMSRCVTLDTHISGKYTY